MFVILSGIEMFCIMNSSSQKERQNIRTSGKGTVRLLKTRRWPKSSPTWTCFSSIACNCLTEYSCNRCCYNFLYCLCLRCVH